MFQFSWDIGLSVLNWESPRQTKVSMSLHLLAYIFLRLSASLNTPDGHLPLEKSSVLGSHDGWFSSR